MPDLKQSLLNALVAAAFIAVTSTAAKGTYIKSIYLSSTMSAGIKIDPKSVDEI